jgi:hypothetical protein
MDPTHTPVTENATNLKVFSQTKELSRTTVSRC